MKNKVLKGLTSIALSFSMLGCANTANKTENVEKSSLAVEVKKEAVDLTRKEGWDNVLSYTSNAKIDYSNVVYPVFYVFAGQKSETEAEDLLKEMGIGSVLEKWAGTVNVIMPVDGKGYTEKDEEAFIELLGGAICNAKVVGIDEGATFVNNNLKDDLYAVAGVMTYGGQMDVETKEGVAVPAYLSNPDVKAKNYFIAVNNAKEVSENVYENPENSLERVVVGQDKDVLSAFQNAWNNIFSKNYRQHNSYTEFYNATAKDIKDNYELINIADYDKLGIQYEAHYNKALNGSGKYTWFEYIPTSTVEKEKGSVPLVVTLHGNYNDTRLQGETTGWTELASKEGFMVVAPEWQQIVVEGGQTEGHPNFFECDGLEGDKLIEWIDM